MTPKLLQEPARIIFLKEFTEELIKNSLPEKLRQKLTLEKPKEIEIEKLRQKFIPVTPEQALTKVSPFFKSKYTKEIEEKARFQKSRDISTYEISDVHGLNRPSLSNLRKPIFHRMRIRQRPFPLRQLEQPLIQPKISPQTQALQITPQPSSRPQDFDLGKLEIFLKDPLVQSIECQGPGKNLLVKKFNRTNTTRVTLSQQEITDIINKFSKQAKIPLVRGILKAAVGDLVISAVTSEYVGSRFVVSKIGYL